MAEFLNETEILLMRFDSVEDFSFGYCPNLIGDDLKKSHAFGQQLEINLRN